MSGDGGAVATRSRWRTVVIVTIASLPYLVGAGLLLHERLQRPTLQISSGNKGGLYFSLGQELQDVLTEGFGGSVRFRNLSSRGSNENLDRIEHGQASLGLAQDGIEATAGVRALARLYNSPYQLVVRAQGSPSDLSDLKRTPKAKIFLGAENSGTWTISHLILEQYGLDLGDFDVVGKEWTMEDAADALLAGNVDAAAFLVGFGAPALSRVAADSRFTLVPIMRAPGIVTMYPYLEQVTIPPGSYKSRALFPATEISTIATRELLVASDDISERTAFRIVDTLFSSSTKVVAHFPLLTQLSRIEPERNFYYPLHAGAIAFYRRDSKPSPFTADKVIGSLGYSITILTFAVVRIYRRRIKGILENIDNINKRVSGATTDQEMADLRMEIRRIEMAAFDLHRRYKIKDENYSVAKEAIRLCRRGLSNRFVELSSAGAADTPTLARSDAHFG